MESEKHEGLKGAVGSSRGKVGEEGRKGSSSLVWPGKLQDCSCKGSGLGSDEEGQLES